MRRACVRKRVRMDQGVYQPGWGVESGCKQTLSHDDQQRSAWPTAITLVRPIVPSVPRGHPARRGCSGGTESKEAGQDRWSDYEPGAARSM